MNITFEDRTVLVTGAAHGFGRAIAGAFAHRGATIDDTAANPVATSRKSPRTRLEFGGF